MLSTAPVVDAPQWEPITTLSSENHALLSGGSEENASSPAA